MVYVCVCLDNMPAELIAAPAEVAPSCELPTLLESPSCCCRVLASNVTTTGGTCGELDSSK